MAKCLQDLSNGEKLGEFATVAFGAKKLGEGRPSVSSILDKRVNLAHSFYEKVGGNAKEISGIDFKSSVRTRTLTKGSIVQQWVRNDGKVGSYFAFEGVDTGKLGINTEGRTLKTFELTDNVKVLESKTIDIGGHKGGETQLYNPELKNNIKEIKN